MRDKAKTLVGLSVFGPAPNKREKERTERVVGRKKEQKGWWAGRKNRQGGGQKERTERVVGRKKDRKGGGQKERQKGWWAERKNRKGGGQKERTERVVGRKKDRKGGGQKEKNRKGGGQKERTERVVGGERRRDTHDPISRLYTSIEFGNRNRSARAFRIWSCEGIAEAFEKAQEGTVFKAGSTVHVLFRCTVRKPL
jgi:hypothetical protein